MNDPKRPPASSPVVMAQPPAAAPPSAASRPPSTPKQPFADPEVPAPADPQADVDTKELSLADLREAARHAEREAGSATVGTEIDLVGAERQEAAEMQAAEMEAAVLEGPAGPTGPSPIDPRIHERRVAVTRAEGRRRLQILLAAVAVASAIGIAWLVVQSPFLAVRTINVQGSARESRAAVAAAAGVREGSALLFVDTGAVARRVEALPWVAKADVDRELPNQLTITVVERSPVAYVRRPVPRGSPEGTLGAVVLVDRFGRVLGDEVQPPPGLPELVGIDHIPERGASIRPSAPAAALSALPDALRAQTGSLAKRRDYAVLMLVALPGGAPPPAGEVRLGSLDSVAAKGAAALAVLDQLASGGEQVGYIDVRVPGAPATG